MTATQSKRLTVADLEAMGEAAEHIELIDGVARIMSPTGGQHGRIQSALAFEVNLYLRAHPLGETYGAETGFFVNEEPECLLAPDFSFIAWERLPEGDDAPIGFFRFAPDLAVEIASPSNTEAELLVKTGRFLEAGSRLVWLIRPRQQTVTIFSPDEPERILGIDDTLDGGQVLPGFALPVKALFRRG